MKNTEMEKKYSRRMPLDWLRNMQRKKIQRRIKKYRGVIRNVSQIHRENEKYRGRIRIVRKYRGRMRNIGVE